MHNKFHRYGAIARTLMLLSFACAAIFCTKSCDSEKTPSYKPLQTKESLNGKSSEQTRHYNVALADSLALAFQKEKLFGDALDNMSLENMLNSVEYLKAALDDLRDKNTKTESIDDNLRAFFKTHGTDDTLVPKIAFAKLIPTMPDYPDEARQDGGKMLTETLVDLYATAFNKYKKYFIREQETA